jgi:hypothetical protein
VQAVQQPFQPHIPSLIEALAAGGDVSKVPLSQVAEIIAGQTVEKPVKPIPAGTQVPTVQPAQQLQIRQPQAPDVVEALQPAPVPQAPEIGGVSKAVEALYSINKALRTAQVQKALGEVAMALTANFPQSPQYALGKFVADAAESDLLDSYINKLRTGQEIKPGEFDGLSPDMKEIAHNVVAQEREVTLEQQKALMGVAEREQKSLDAEANRLYKVLSSGVKTVPESELFDPATGAPTKVFKRALLWGSVDIRNNDQLIAMQDAVIDLKAMGRDTMGLEEKLIPSLKYLSKSEIEALPAFSYAYDINGNLIRIAPKVKKEGEAK